MTRPRVKDSPSPPLLLTSLRAWLTRDSPLPVKQEAMLRDRDNAAWQPQFA
jgi:hypothetical protein